MPVNVVCERCGHTRTISRDELQSGQWRKPCPVCQPRDDDEREIIDDETREDQAA
jgi:hypothetical protein